MPKSTAKKLVYIFMAIGVIVALFSGSNIKNILNLRRKINSQENRLQILKETNKRLANEIKWIKTEDEYIKYLAKKNLGLIEPGEIKFYITEYNEVQEH